MAKDKDAAAGYTVEDLLDGKNNALYADVEAKAPIQYKHHKEGPWEGVLLGDKKSSFVGTAPSDKPGPCFAHELLHIKLELEGLIKPKRCKVRNGFVETIRQLCNDLAHHRMYPAFLALGYAPGEFMTAEEDAGAEKCIDDYLMAFEERKAENRQPVGLHVLACYLLINNPHDTKVQHRERLIAAVGAERIDAFDGILKEWRESDSKDYSPYLAKLLGICGAKGWQFGMDEEHMFVS